MFRYDLGDDAELRILEARHAPALLELVRANREHFGAWLGWALTMDSVEDAAAFIRRGLARFAEDGLPWAGIWLGGRMVGGLLFFPIDRRINATAIGYWLGREAAGRGLMTRAAGAMIDFAFELGVNRVALEAEVDNAASRAVADRLGFSFEGVRRDGWVNAGRLVDIAVYALLARDRRPPA